MKATLTPERPWRSSRTHRRFHRKMNEMDAIIILEGAFGLEQLNCALFRDLEGILGNYEKKWHLKLFSVYKPTSEPSLQAFKIHRIFDHANEDRKDIQSDSLSSPSNIFMKLGLTDYNSEANLNKLLENPYHFPFTEIPNAVADDSESSFKADTDSTVHEVFYAVKLPIQLDANNLVDTVYIICIRYVDTVSRTQFYEMPEVSFLRMLLDCFFTDFYASGPNQTLIAENEKLKQKFREDSALFLQRTTRAYLGKLENLLVKGNNFSSLSTMAANPNQASDPQFAVNTLFEKIDGISIRTYEGSNPFGCMLLMSRDQIINNKIVKFAIEFQSKDDRLQFEDSRRIRKLLELTNRENDLYLIADTDGVYGIGEIDWSEVDKALLVKVEFKGLSHYDIQVLEIKKEKSNEANLVTFDRSKTYKQTFNYNILPHSLLSVSFKRPGLTDGGYTPNRFRQLLLSQFENLEDEAINRLQLVVQEAKDQQSGTMVVIADKQTAENELKILRKQSTLIKPREVNSAFIRYLTSIDGAIYLDTSGTCHAIGVILDGLAFEHHGDASRGARYHSAYRYLHKLHGQKGEQKGCVIAIVSEDGNVDLIPESDNEATVRQMVTNYVDYIVENTELMEDTLAEYDELIANYKTKDFIDPFHYFAIGDAFLKNENYQKAHFYFSEGLNIRGEFIEKYNRKQVLSLLQNSLSFPAIEKKKALQKGLELLHILIEHVLPSHSNALSNDYNNQGVTFRLLGDLAEGDERNSLYEQALHSYNQSVLLAEESFLLPFSNRASLFTTLNRLEDALNDLISAELISHDNHYVSRIMNIVKKDNTHFRYALDAYSNLKTETKDSVHLKQELLSYGDSIKLDDTEIAAAMEGIK
jgi:tetratricopeptide (TPR) repeat protein